MKYMIEKVNLKGTYNEIMNYQPDVWKNVMKGNMESDEESDDLESDAEELDDEAVEFIADEV